MYYSSPYILLIAADIAKIFPYISDSVKKKIIWEL